MVDNRENAKWTVYVHIIPKEITGYDWDKYYVGITSKVKPEHRWHKDGGGYKTHKYFWNAIQRWGWNNFEHEIIAKNLTEQEAKNFEIKLISLLNTQDKHYGYNLTAGGDGCTNCTPEKSTRLLMSANNVSGKNPNAKRVYQFSKTGEFIQCYDCYSDAVKKDPLLPNGGVAYAIKHHHLLGGYLWGRDEDIYYDDNGYIKLNYSYDVTLKRWKKYQFDLNGKYINSYFTYKEAEEKTGCSRSAIESSANNYTPTKYYIWRNECDVLFDNNDVPYIKDFDLVYKKVYQFDLYNNFIAEYISKKEAEKETNISSISISSCVNHLAKTAGGYIWAYENDILYNGEQIKLKDYDEYNIFPKTVFRFNNSKKFIGKYESPLIAEQITGIKRNIIQHSLNWKTKNPYKNADYWRYKEDVKESEEDTDSFIMLR